ncbi:hypothetical protein [Gordonia sp. VNK21]|uniref:hypothetical protein n=1 Tax=Gordonia sp. VNK21 TaxID=3382483 RepID=UPI0038D472E1
MSDRTPQPGDADFPIEEGATVAPMLLGIPAGGLIRLWSSPEESALYSVDEEGYEELAVLIGSGAIARTFPVNGRSQEAGMFHDESGLLLVQNGEPVEVDQDTAADGDTEMPEFGTSIFTLNPAGEEQAQDDPWAELEETVTQVVVDSFARGELVVVEPLGYTPDGDALVENPYVLIGLAQQEDGTIHVLVEGSPAPAKSEIWPPSDDPRGATLTAPADEDAVNVTGSLAIDAVKEWGVGPWDLIITYVDPAEAFGAGEAEQPPADED